VKGTEKQRQNCYDICVVSVMKVELDGLRVYDPKLENAGNSEIRAVKGTEKQRQDAAGISSSARGQVFCPVQAARDRATR
jgi:hypothetical protein